MDFRSSRADFHQSTWLNLESGLPSSELHISVERTAEATNALHSQGSVLKVEPVPVWEKEEGRVWADPQKWSPGVLSTDCFYLCVHLHRSTLTWMETDNAVKIHELSACKPATRCCQLSVSRDMTIGGLGFTSLVLAFCCTADQPCSILFG